MGEPRSRGWLIDGIVAFLGEDQRRRFAAEASGPLSVLVSTAKKARPDWIPHHVFVEAVVLADRIAGSGDLSLCWKIGQFVATHEVGAVQALAMRVLRPSIIMSLAPGLWSTHFQDAGRVNIRATGDRALIVSFLDFPEPNRAHCLAVGGWIQGWLGLGPRRSIRVDHHSCRCQGNASCNYAVAWED